MVNSGFEGLLRFGSGPIYFFLNFVWLCFIKGIIKVHWHIPLTRLIKVQRSLHYKSLIHPFKNITP